MTSSSRAMATRSSLLRFRSSRASASCNHSSAALTATSLQRSLSISASSTCRCQFVFDVIGPPLGRRRGFRRRRGIRPRSRPARRPDRSQPTGKRSHQVRIPEPGSMVPRAGRESRPRPDRTPIVCVADARRDRSARARRRIAGRGLGGARRRASWRRSIGRVACQRRSSPHRTDARPH